MKPTEEKRPDRRLLAVGIPALIILLPFVYSVGAWAVAAVAPSDEPFLERPDARFEECVRDTEYMRFNHMSLLLETRDGIRVGERGDVGLSRLKAGTVVRTSAADHESRAYCSDCHTSRESFCNQCHTAVNLNLDCFACHEYE
jgi:hypothetical protein